MLLLPCILFGAILQICSLAVIEIPKGVSLTATRTIDLTFQMVKIKVEYEIKNAGSSEMNYFVHIVDFKEAENLAWISATQVENKKKLDVSKVCSLKIFVLLYFRLQ